VTATRRSTGPFRYAGYHLDPATARLVCRYVLGPHRFEERFTFDPGGDWGHPAVDAAARLVHLLAGVSYFKTAAPDTVDLGDLVTTRAEREFLRTYYVDGLGEFAYRNGIDLSDLAVVGPAIDHREPVATRPAGDRPLVPFGGGIDSIVTAEHVRARFPDAALFVVGGPGGPFSAIERPAAVTGLPVVRAERVIDSQLLGPEAAGFLNGHVPVTGIISAVAVMAAVLSGRDPVVMSNEWSASIGSVTGTGAAVNHQYSKSLAFETGFRTLLGASLGATPRYFSLLRPFSELWVARRFAELPGYHLAFRSCNRAFHLDPALRLDHWCGVCDKCCFIDLVLAPFLPPAVLSEIFGGREPLDDPALAPRFRALTGTSRAAKPFDCVGDVGECRAAVLLAAARPDRAGCALLRTLAAEVAGAGGVPAGNDHLRPMGDHFVPDAYAAQDQLV
jgi:hypothetical protein